MLTAFILSFVLTSQSPSEPPSSYGEIFFEETQALELPEWYLSVGYARDLSSTFLDLDSIAGGAQYKIWKYLSTGIFGQWMHSRLTSSGRSLEGLEDVDINFDLSVPRWGIFSLTELQLMLGKWNVLNLFPIQVDLIIGGGAGILRREMRLDGRDLSQFSYLWAIEQRVGLSKNFGVFVSFFGHRGAAFVHPGLALRF